MSPTLRIVDKATGRPLRKDDPRLGGYVLRELDLGPVVVCRSCNRRHPRRAACPPRGVRT